MSTATLAQTLDQAAIRFELTQAMKNCPDIDSCILSTVDGHEVFSLSQRPTATDRLSTMNSSILALAETMARESQQELCRFVILENSNGRIVVLRVNRHLLLTCVSNLDSKLGMVLTLGQRAAKSLAATIGG